MDIASTLDHEALHLFLSRQIAEPVRQVEKPRRRRHWSYYVPVDEDTSLSFAAYSKVAEFIDSYMQDLHPAPVLHTHTHIHFTHH
jgi:hypothetical protein